MKDGAKDMVKKAAYATPNHLLRAARKERGWTQQQVADYIGAPLALNISRWENGTAFPSVYYLQRLCQLFGKSAHELGLSQLEEETQSEQDLQARPSLEQEQVFTDRKTGRQDQVHSQATSRIGKVSFPRNPFFVGREDLLVRLRQQFLASQTKGYSQPLAISGLGGISKTQLVLEYAYRHLKDYQAIFWTRADSRDSLVAGFLEIASILRLPERDERDQSVVVAAVKNWLSQHTGWLLIMDNADEPTLLPEFLASPLPGHLLLTTRARALGGLADRIELETLDVDTGPLLLLRRAGLLALDAPLAQAKPIDWQAAVLLSQEMGGLPLALDQAGSYLEETGCSPQQYLELYRSHGVNLLRSRGGVVLDHPDSIATSWSLSFALIEQRSTLAADLLRLCAVLHPDAIPEELFLKAGTHMSPSLAVVEASPLAFNQALAIAQSYSLVQRNGHEQTLSMHRLVQAVLLDAMSRQEREQWRERAIAALKAVFPDMMFEGWESWEQCSRLLPHVLTIAADTSSQQREFASLLSRAADYLRQRAQFEQARLLYQRALSIYEQTLGPDHPQIAFPLNILANLYRNQGRFEEAEPLYRRALAIRRQQRGDQHIETAISLADFARLHELRNQPELALALYQQALSIREHLLGLVHPETRETRECCARLLLACGQPEEDATF